MKEDKWKILAVGLIILLALAGIYVTADMALERHDLKTANEAQTYFALFLLNEVVEKGYVGITYGNQTLVLVPYVPEEKEVN